MSVVIRTLSPQDAEMLARTIVDGVVSNGRVERYDLRWRSNALRTWEVSQRALGRRPDVQIRIDELNLSVVYVTPLDGSNPTIRATSMLPKYTENLSLFEHRKLKEKMKERQIRDRLVAMGDERAFNLRIEYYATLGRASDPVAYRRLVGLRDQLAALREKDLTSAGDEAVSTATEANAVVPEEPGKPTPKPTRRPRKGTPTPTPESTNAPIANQDPAPIATQSQNVEADSEYSFTPTLPHFFIKRTLL